MNIHQKPPKVRATQSLLAARAHIEALRDSASAVMNFRVVAETPAAEKVVKDADHRIRLRYRGTIDSLFDTLKGRNEKGFAVYYVLNLTDGKGTKRENFTHTVALPLDLDDAPLPEIWLGGIKPHLIVETSPGKFQCIFNIEPTTDKKAAKQMAQRLAAAYGGDPKVCDTPRVLRLAGLLHQKGAPFVSRIVETNPFEPPYKLAQFNKVLPKLPAPTPREGPSGEGQMTAEGAALLLDGLDPAGVVPTNAEFVEFAPAAKVACADEDAESYVLEWLARDGGHDAEDAEYRWNSFSHEQPEGGIGVGTFIKVLKDHGVSASKIKTVFSPTISAADDFDDVEDDDERLPWEDTKPTPKQKIHRTKSGLRYQLASEVTPEKIDWLWPDRLARGKLNFIAGPPDQGKSQITCDLSARVSNGTEWPNHEGKIDEPGSVIILAAEDDAADTILPRLVAAGADLTKIFILQMMVRPLANKGERVFNVAEDIALLTELIESKPDHKFKLLIIDPINSYMGGTDTWKAGEVRTVLAPLGNWSEKQGVSTLFLSHLSKGGKGAALNRVLDSGAFTAVCRSGWFVAPEMEDKAETGTKFFVKGKNNLGPPKVGLTYPIESKRVEHKGVTLPSVPYIVWTGTTDKSSAQALDQMDNGGERKEKVTLAQAAQTFLDDELSAGPMDLDALKERAK